MNLSALPDRRATENPSGPAVADDDTDLNNAEFLSAVQRAAATLQRHGVSAGDVVAIMLPNTAGFVVSLFAAWRLGAAVTPINPSLRPVEVDYQVSDAAAKVLIAETPPDFDTRAPAVVTTGELGRGEPGSEPDGPAAVRRRQPGTAHLHQRDHRAAQGRDARSRQPHRDVRLGGRRVRADLRRPQPADSAAVPRQRNRRGDAVAASRRWQGDGRGPVQAGHVLRPDRTEPRDVFLRRTNDLHDAVRSARQREAGHVISAVRDLWSRTGQRRTAGGVRVPIRDTADRRLRTVGRLLCEHGQSGHRQTQSGNGWAPPARPDDPTRRR